MMLSFAGQSSISRNNSRSSYGNNAGELKFKRGVPVMQRMPRRQRQ